MKNDLCLLTTPCLGREYRLAESIVRSTYIQYPQGTWPGFFRTWHIVVSGDNGLCTRASDPHCIVSLLGGYSSLASVRSISNVTSGYDWYER